MSFIGGHWVYLVILSMIVLIIWGPGKLPDVGAGLGRGIREFRKASAETHDSFTQTVSGTQSAAPTQPPLAASAVVKTPLADADTDPGFAATPPQTPVAR
jgi:TatA/E family protein of Tat protein translocase